MRSSRLILVMIKVGVVFLPESAISNTIHKKGDAISDQTKINSNHIQCWLGMKEVREYNNILLLLPFLCQLTMTGCDCGMILMVLSNDSSAGDHPMCGCTDVVCDILLTQSILSLHYDCADVTDIRWSYAPLCSVRR